jgi:Fur family ferric uptake transcriptional regulator
MSWATTAIDRLDQAGYRSGASRRRVIELLGSQRCAVTALDIDRRLKSVGRASVYRTLEQLEELHLIQRVEIGGDSAGYERIDSDAHHHHLVCERCERLAPFSSAPLEEAIAEISSSADFEVATHDVVLRGLCRSCQGAGQA